MIIIQCNSLNACLSYNVSKDVNDVTAFRNCVTSPAIIRFTFVMAQKRFQVLIMLLCTQIIEEESTNEILNQ